MQEAMVDFYNKIAYIDGEEEEAPKPSRRKASDSALAPEISH